jgi:DNA segregation ATPase FtsK/SpoIIIE-like protein
MTAALLSVCATTSPEELSVIVIDPKGLDFPVDGIPHLACSVVTDGARACEIVGEVANILAQRAKSKDRAASRRRILLMVDELGYLIQSGNAEIADNLTSIAAMGRAWGISLFIGSQRATNEFFPKSIHSNLPAKWTGRVKDAGEAVFASGQPGCDAHKLPGKGAAMLYEPTGIVRLQSAYIGDANKDNYPEVVGEFISDLQKKWAGKRPHWRLGDPDQSTADPGDNNDNSGTSGKPLQAMIEDAVRKVLTEMATIQPATEQPEAQETEPDQPEINTAILENLPDGVLPALEAAYNEAPERFNKSRVREAWRAVTGVRPKTEKEDKIFTAFLAYVEK